MKKYFIITLISLIITGSLLPVFSQNAPGQKWALTIAIDKYPKEAGVEELKYAIKNADEMENLFITYYGVPKENIISVRNEMATQENIKNTLQNIAAKVSQNDYLYIYINMEGQNNFPDFNGDERDGSDECLVPYDCQWKYPKTYINDEKFTNWIKDIKGKLICMFDVAGGGDLIDFNQVTGLETRTIILSHGGFGGVVLEDSYYEGKILTHYILKDTEDLYNDYLDEIKSNSDEAASLTLNIIFDEIKKDTNSYMEKNKEKGECVVTGKLNPKQVIIIKK